MRRFRSASRLSDLGDMVEEELRETHDAGVQEGYLLALNEFGFPDPFWTQHPDYCVHELHAGIDSRFQVCERCGYATRGEVRTYGKVRS